MEIKVFDTAVEASHFVANEILAEVKNNPRLTLGLATGRTMDSIYHHLVQAASIQKVDFSNVNAFAVDEYIGLDPQSENSFEFYLHLHLFNQLNFSSHRIHIPKTEFEDIDTTCVNYEEKIKKIGGIDLQLLGVGMNGHIGLNEPGSSFDSRSRVVALTSSTKQSNRSLFEGYEVPNTAVTVGIGTILDSKKIFLVATGETKSEIIQRLVNGDVSSKVPASAIKMHKNSILILDKKAAKLI